jgi:hypothetical protein
MTTETALPEISTDSLRKTFVEFLPSEMSDSSALVRLGAPAVAPNITSFTRVELGAPAAVAEGDVKPATNYTLKEDEVKKTTLTHIIMATKQSLTTAEGQEQLQDLFRQAAGHFARGTDTVFLHGTNPVDGAALPEFAGTAIIPNAIQNVYSTGESFDRVLHEASLEVENPNGLGLSKEGYVELATLYTDQGVRKYPNATKKAAFEFLDMTTVTDRVFGEPGWNGSTSDVLAVEGDFSQVRVGIGNITVEKATQGNIGNVNLFTTNRVAFLIEVEIGGVNLAPHAFVATKKGA